MAESQEKNTITKKLDDFPAAVRNKLVMLTALFIGGGIALILFFFVMGMLDFWYLPIAVIGYGLYLIMQLYYLASNEKLREIEGVVIDKEKSGYRKQNHFLVVQTSKGAVYRVFATDHSSQYKEGDIVRFYSTREALNNLKDGVFEVRVVYAIERVSAKVTTDEEDEKILRQEDFVTEKEKIQDT